MSTYTVPVDQEEFLKILDVFLDDSVKFHIEDKSHVSFNLNEITYIVELPLCIL